nr:hypothetical protein [Baia soyae]
MIDVNIHGVLHGLPPGFIAQSISDAIHQPADVDVNEIVVRPTSA